MTDAGILYGVAIGEAMAWPSRWQRARLMPAWTRRRARELAAFADEQRTTDPVVPFGLNVTPTVLRSGPGAVTEWVADTAHGVAEGRSVDELWRRRADAVEQVAGPISAMTALDWLAEDVQAVGAHNPHGLDDSAATRALGIVAGHRPGTDNPHRLIEADAARTNHADGLAAARLIGELALGEPLDAVLERYRGEGRLGRQLTDLAALALTAGDVWSLAADIDPLTDATYSYGCLAGDTVPAAFAFYLWHTANQQADVMATMAAAATLVRQAGTLPALVGGLLGARVGAAAFPTSWRERVAILSGCALPWLAGVPLDPTAA